LLGSGNLNLCSIKVVKLGLCAFYLLFMTTPLLLQLYFFVFGLGEWIPFLLSSFGILGLGFHYMAIMPNIFHCHYKVSVKYGQS